MQCGVPLITYEIKGENHETKNVLSGFYMSAVTISSPVRPHEIFICLQHKKSINLKLLLVHVWRAMIVKGTGILFSWTQENIKVQTKTAFLQFEHEICIQKIANKRTDNIFGV